MAEESWASSVQRSLDYLANHFPAIASVMGLLPNSFLAKDERYSGLVEANRASATKVTDLTEEVKRLTLQGVDLRRDLADAQREKTALGIRLNSLGDLESRLVEYARQFEELVLARQIVRKETLAMEVMHEQTGEKYFGLAIGGAGRIISASANAARRLGYSASDIRGTGFYDLVKDPEFVRGMMNKAVGNRGHSVQLPKVYFNGLNGKTFGAGNLDVRFFYTDSCGVDEYSAAAIVSEKAHGLAVRARLADILRARRRARAGKFESEHSIGNGAPAFGLG